MWSLEKLNSRSKEIGYIHDSAVKKEFALLPDILMPDETLESMTSAFLKKIHGRDINGTGIIVCTNKRVIFLRKSIIGTLTMEEITLSKISTVSLRKGMLLASIHVITSNNEAIAENIPKSAAEHFRKTCVSLINNSEVAPIVRDNQSSGINKYAEIERLFAMKEKGILTEEEFQEQKRRILA